jgi:hypothetical protein
MKKIFVFLFFIGLLFSCTESMQYNNDPTMKALKDNEQWEAYTSSAVAATAKITIVAIGDNQSVTLKMKLPDGFVSQTDTATYITYTLGTASVNQAIFATQINGLDYMYLTQNGIGDGEIVITNYDGVTISEIFEIASGKSLKSFFISSPDLK